MFSGEVIVEISEDPYETKSILTEGGNMRKSIIISGTIMLMFLLVTFLQKGVEGQAGYIGVDTCKGCHEDKFDSISRQAHGKKAVSGSPAMANACETCHGHRTPLIVR